MSRAKRLEEILEECVSAHLEGRRSLEQSLSLYPALRSELEPLLRTAIGLKSTLHGIAPSPAAQQRGLARFLSDARARRNLKTFRRQARPGWFANIFAPQYRMGMGAIAVGLAITAVAVGMATFNGGSDNGTAAVENITTPTSAPTDAPPTPAAVRAFQSPLETIRTKVNSNTPVDAVELQQLTAAALGLRTESSLTTDDVEATIQDADDLLATIVSTQPLTPEVQDAVDAVRDVAGFFDVDLTATPPATEVPTAVTEPTTPPSGEPTVAPTSAPTEAPSAPPTDVPTPTPDSRFPQ